MYHSIKTPQRCALPLVLIGLTLYATSGHLQAQSLVLVAQASGLDSAIGKGMGVMSRIAYLGAYGLMIYAGWQVSQGKQEAAKWGIIGALICAVASLIVKALFNTGETPINITPS